jgi:hypothetical protein
MIPLTVVPLETETVEVSFPVFWVLYPRHIARKDANKAWDRLKPDEQLAAIVGIALWRRVYLDRGLEWCPHASTYLNGARWEDELPAEYRNRPASHVPATPSQPLPDRGVLPDHIRSLFAKLKGGKTI